MTPAVPRSPTAPDWSTSRSSTCRPWSGSCAGRPETLGIKPSDVTSTYLIIDPSGDPTTPDAVEISVYVSSDFGSGSLELNPDGSTKRVSYPS